jgi:hypothetical protein
MKHWEKERRGNKGLMPAPPASFSANLCQTRGESKGAGIYIRCFRLTRYQVFAIGHAYFHQRSLSEFSLMLAGRGAIDIGRAHSESANSGK